MSCSRHSTAGKTFESIVYLVFCVVIAMVTWLLQAIFDAFKAPFEFNHQHTDLEACNNTTSVGTVELPEQPAAEAKGQQLEEGHLQQLAEATASNRAAYLGNELQQPTDVAILAAPKRITSEPFGSLNTACSIGSASSSSVMALVQRHSMFIAGAGNITELAINMESFGAAATVSSTTVHYMYSRSSSLSLQGTPMPAYNGTGSINLMGLTKGMKYPTDTYSHSPNGEMLDMTGSIRRHFITGSSTAGPNSSTGSRNLLQIWDLSLPGASSGCAGSISSSVGRASGSISMMGASSGTIVRDDVLDVHRMEMIAISGGRLIWRVFTSQGVKDTLMSTTAAKAANELGRPLSSFTSGNCIIGVDLGEGTASSGSHSTVTDQDGAYAHQWVASPGCCCCKLCCGSHGHSKSKSLTTEVSLLSAIEQQQQQQPYHNPLEGDSPGGSCPTYIFDSFVCRGSCVATPVATHTTINITPKRTAASAKREMLAAGRSKSNDCSLRDQGAAKVSFEQ